ncbi:MAG: M28 family peptidase [Enterocloster clostridioformis]
MGAYQTDFHTGGFREFSLVYLGKGTAADYSQADVAGKLVLIDINQRDEWWINFPVYQARLKGAAALIAVQEQGYGEISDTALNAQDIAGPADAPAFSMSRADAGVLKAAMGEENQVRVRLDASSTVLKDQETYNIIGTIPGTEEGMILLSAHYDSYFSGFQDDNAAVAMMLGIARAVLRSGYKPRKTLVFCAMAAEEWGVVNSKYDWSAGAYEQVFTAKPDWAGKVIADLNFELPAHAHGRKDAVRCVYEYADFLEEFITGLPAGFLPASHIRRGVEVLRSPIQTWSDDFSMAIGGIPSMVNDFSAGEFMETHYHSQYDNENFYQRTCVPLPP